MCVCLMPRFPYPFPSLCGEKNMTKVTALISIKDMKIKTRKDIHPVNNVAHMTRIVKDK